MDLAVAEASIRRERWQLRPGDHIYAWRSRFAYAFPHHGIYESDRKVIHFTRDTPPSEQSSAATVEEVVKTTALATLAAAAAVAAGPAGAAVVAAGTLAAAAGGGGAPVYALSPSYDLCWECRQAMRGGGGVVSYCLDCFLKGDNLRVFAYSAPFWFYNASAQIGMITNRALETCSMEAEDPPDTVLRRANDLLARNGFGSYHPLANNCYDFAFYCKTGRHPLASPARQRDENTCMIL